MQSKMIESWKATSATARDLEEEWGLIAYKDSLRNFVDSASFLQDIYPEIMRVAMTRYLGHFDRLKMEGKKFR